MSINQTTYQQYYQQDIALINNFFHWKTDHIQELLINDINRCIQDQHFERAWKLRDIYMQINQHTQKQTVLLDKNIDGIIASINTTDLFLMVVIIIFQKGKIIDILRFHYRQQESDENQIIQSLKLEYGELQSKQWVLNWLWTIYYSLWWKLTKSLWIALEEHLLAYQESFVASSLWKESTLTDELLHSLKTRYNLSLYPSCIECIDISHLSGWRASWWVSRMQWWMLDKSSYRRYKISPSNAGDDYASIKEVLLRRYWAKKWTQKNYLPYPDLCIIDGAHNHLHGAQQLFEQWLLEYSLLEKTQFVSLGKGDARQSGRKIQWAKEKLFVLEYLKSKNKCSIVEYTLCYDAIDKIMVTIRDEAHRFANAYRKKQYSIEFISS